MGEAALLGSLLQIGGMLGNFTVGMKMDRWDHHKVVGADGLLRWRLRGAHRTAAADDAGPLAR